MMQDLLFVLRSRREMLVLGSLAVVALFFFEACPCPCFGSRSGGYSKRPNEIFPGLPLAFEKNEGQAPAGYRFITTGLNYQAGFTSRGLALLVRDEGSRHSQSIFVGFAGTDRDADLAGEELLRGRANYFIGNKPEDWHTDVPSFGRVRYRGVYPGIDVVYYGQKRQLENDFVVAPGADPSLIRLQIGGAQTLRVEESGDLVIGAAGRELRWKKPTIYQPGGASRVPVEGGYVQNPDRTIGFRVARYDRGKPLVIDPVLVYASYLGRNQDESATRVALDPAGNIVIAGVTDSVNFPTIGGIDPPSGRSTSDALLVKLSADGSTLLFSAVFGGGIFSAGMGVALDPAGNIYLGGSTAADDFPVTQGAFQTKYGGVGVPAKSVGDGFVLKITPAGNRIVYSTYLGGSDSDGVSAIAVDAQGSVYATGGTASSNFPVTQNAFQTFYRGSNTYDLFTLGDAFVAKLNPQGSALVYSTLLGGGGDDVATSIAIDPTGVAYVGGFTNSVNFPTLSPVQPAYRGSGGQANSMFGDGFITAVNPTGTGLVYSTYLGGRNDDGVIGISADSSGNVYATGSTLSADFPTTPNAQQPNYRGGSTNIVYQAGDAFYVKLNRSGALVYSTYLGGSNNDAGAGITVDAGGNVYVTGFTDSTDFPLTAAVQSTFKGAGGQGQLRTGDAFIAEYDPSGKLIFSTYLGGSGDDAGTGIVVDSSGNIVIAGATVSGDFPVTPDALQRGYSGSGGGSYFPQGDLFIARLGTAATIGVNAIQHAASYASPPVAPGEAVTVYGFGMTNSPNIVGLALDANGRVATSLSGARLLFDGTAAPLIYVSAKQSSAFVPYSVAGKSTVALVAEYNGVRSAPLNIAVAAAAPGLFSADSSGKGPGAILNQDGSLNSAANPADRNTIITLFGTGEGQTVPPGVDGQVAATIFPKPALPLLVQIGGVSSFDVPYYGAAPQASAGVLQVNVRIPVNAPTGVQPVVVSVGGIASQNGLTVAIR